MSRWCPLNYYWLGKLCSKQATNSLTVKFRQTTTIRNFVKRFWKVKDCGVNCFVRLNSTSYAMNGTYELCFCWSFRLKAMLVISEHSILRQVFHNMAVYNVPKTSIYFWSDAIKWYGPIVWWIRFLSFLVNGKYVACFHWLGIVPILIQS